MSLSSLCNTTGTFQRKSVVPDSMKLGHDESFATIATISMSLQPANGRTKDDFARRAGFEVSHLAYMTTIVALNAGDRLNHAGRYYIVQGPQRDMAGRSRAYSVPLLLKDQ